MLPLRLAARRLFRQGEHSISKLLTLTLGLSVSVLLLSIVIYQRSYERDFPHHDRICIVKTHGTRQSQEGDKPEELDFSQVSGGVAPAIQEEIPGVELATRTTLYGTSKMILEDNKTYETKTLLAEPAFLDMFGVELIAGVRDSALRDNMTCLISESLARKMGGDVLGKRLRPAESKSDRAITIGGVFEDLPHNSSIQADMLLPITWMPAESLNNWIGNDRYIAYVRLRPGVSPESLDEALLEMQKRHQDMEVFRKAGVELHYSLTPFNRLRLEDPTLVNMLRIQQIVAIAVLLISLLNYVLMTLASMVNRRRVAAIRKCYGAMPVQIQGTMIWETFLYLFLSLVLAVLTVILFRKPMEALIETPLLHLISWRVAAALAGVLAMATFFMGWIPGYSLSRTPVMNIFRKSVAHNRLWKLGLLAVEFVAATFLFGLLAITGLQYRHMIGQDAGYKAAGLYYVPIESLDQQQLPVVIEKLKALPEVEGYTLTTALPASSGQSGDNLIDPVTDRELINVADLFYVDEHYLKVYDIELLEGKNFDAATEKDREIMLSKKAATELARLMNWKDGVIGKNIILTSFGRVVIRGVYDDLMLRRQHLSPYPEKLPSAIVYGDDWLHYLTIRLRHDDARLLHRVNGILSEADPYKETSFLSVEMELLSRFEAAKTFRNTILFGSVVAILIALIGLVGYVNTEVNRRRKELAIRKINGAGEGDILRLFLRSIFRLSLPSVLAGLFVAYLFGRNWLEKFSYRIELNGRIFLLVGLFVLLIIALAVVINLRRIARRNPVNELRYE